MTDRANDLAAGDRVGHFRVLAQLGRGGMGSVYLAEDETLERRIALKVILPELSGDEDFRKRFEREAKSAAAIDHPNVVPVYAAGLLEGRLFLSMRYVEGADLERRLARNPDGKLDVNAALHIVSIVASALDAAHERGLVHRDVKPANILIDDRGNADSIYLTDFGLTKPWGAKGETQSEVWLGTPDYAAPEQMKSGWVDARTDVYSLGCVLYRMLSGSVPHRTAGPGKVLSIVDDPITRIPGVDPRLNEAIQKATAKDPENRFASAGDLARAAKFAASGHKIPSASSRRVAVGPASSGMSEANLSEAATKRHSEPQTRATAQLPAASKDHRGRRTPLLAAAAIAVVVAGIVSGLVISRGGSDDAETVVKTLNSTITREAEQTGANEGDQGQASRSQSVPGLGPFGGIAYSLEVPNGWDHDEAEAFSSDGGFYTNIWRDTSDPENTYIRVDGGNREPASDPMAASESLVDQLREASDYREYFYGPELLQGRAAARWVFSIDGNKRVDYFFTECGRGLAVVGSTLPARFPELQPMFRAVAASAYVDCSSSEIPSGSSLGSLSEAQREELEYVAELPNGDPGYVLPEDQRSIACIGYSAVDGECVGD